MIPLKRIRTAEAIKPMYRGSGKMLRDKQLLLAQRSFLQTSKKISYSSDYWKKAKVQLKAETEGKCAYCEANAQVVAHGDVEHYRPKSVYWWLAYTYDNYLYSCQICNQVYKSDNFPISGYAFPAPGIVADTPDGELDKWIGNISPDPLAITECYTLHKYLLAHIAEEALLINPYIDDPAKFFKYEADDVKREVTMVAAQPECVVHVKAMEDYYGINRIELRNFRYNIYTKFRTFKKVLEVIDDEELENEIREQIDDMLGNHYLFAGMNRYFNALL